MERTVLLRRRSEGHSKVLVAKNAEVSPDTVLMEGDVAAGFRSIDLAKALEIPPKKGLSCLLKKPGEKIRRGEEIAVAKKIFGLGASRIVSPIDGEVKEYNEATGILLLQFLPRHEQIFAGTWGEVETIEGSEVIVRTKMLEIYGVIGSGKLREGIIKMAAGQQDFLLASQIDDSCKKKVLVGGGLVASESFSKALVFGVAGIVAAGMHARDFWAVGGGTISPYAQSSDVGITSVLLEGFGHLSFFDNVYKVLKEHEGQMAFVDGDQAKISIPLALKPDPKEKMPDAEDKRKLKKLEIGDFVRIVGFCNFGLYGKVKNIGTEKMVFESGLSGNFVELETSKGIVKVPPCNLEILI